MRNVKEIKDQIIDTINGIDDAEYLIEIESLISALIKNDVSVQLTHEQKLMLQMGMDDISAGRYLTQEELDEKDKQWLNEP
ncbi:MAG: hypothetical protein JXR22_13665 [Prolixibacteraceae bacterium]|nr:hypothetical protein [Prolixibacteraceae bacterium]